MVPWGECSTGWDNGGCADLWPKNPSEHVTSTGSGIRGSIGCVDWDWTGTCLLVSTGCVHWDWPGTCLLVSTGCVHWDWTGTCLLVSTGCVHWDWTGTCLLVSTGCVHWDWTGTCLLVSTGCVHWDWTEACLLLVCCFKGSWTCRGQLLDNGGAFNLSVSFALCGPTSCPRRAFPNAGDCYEGTHTCTGMHSKGIGCTTTLALSSLQ